MRARRRHRLQARHLHSLACLLTSPTHLVLSTRRKCIAWLARRLALVFCRPWSLPRLPTVNTTIVVSPHTRHLRSRNSSSSRDHLLSSKDRPLATSSPAPTEALTDLTALKAPRLLSRCRTPRRLHRSTKASRPRAAEMPSVRHPGLLVLRRTHLHPLTTTAELPARDRRRRRHGVGQARKDHRLLSSSNSKPRRIITT